MKAELKQMTRKQLEKLRTDIESALKALDEKDKKAALKAAQAAAKAHGFNLDELTGEGAEKPAPRIPRAKRNADGRAKVAPKYRNPSNPDQTWSGRGRAPGWMAAHLEAGGQKEDLAI